MARLSLSLRETLPIIVASSPHLLHESPERGLCATRSDRMRGWILSCRDRYRLPTTLRMVTRALFRQRFPHVIVRHHGGGTGRRCSLLELSRDSRRLLSKPALLLSPCNHWRSARL